MSDTWYPRETVSSCHLSHQAHVGSPVGRAHGAHTIDVPLHTSNQKWSFTSHRVLVDTHAQALTWKWITWNYNLFWYLEESLDLSLFSTVPAPFKKFGEPILLASCLGTRHPQLHSTLESSFYLEANQTPWSVKTCRPQRHNPQIKKVGGYFWLPAKRVC